MSIQIEKNQEKIIVEKNRNIISKIKKSTFFKVKYSSITSKN